ncbi:MAG: glycoside hydrolase family 127 protein [Lachnospiraceae bacterium]|nr:glycoside hydrolase family 127 protein [Lachnospiraceae bacterium]
MNNRIESFDLSDVSLNDSEMKKARDRVLSFIKKMEPDRVLCAFRRNAGVSDLGATPYGGWENSLIGGHDLGHYFSAAAMAVASLHDKELEENLKYIVSSLREVQRYYGNGFLSAATCEKDCRAEEQFDIEEGKKTGKTWVPWYALHKVLQGVLDIYIYTDNKEALEVAKDLGKWVCRRALSWNETIRNRILKTEYGGMNDVLYQLYFITKDEEFKKAAEVFCDETLYAHLSYDEDALNGVHANTTIPKYIGAMHNEGYLDVTKDFYWRVVNTQTYPTGAVGDMEHFRRDGLLDGARSQCNGESCCTYNMMKLSTKLFKKTEDESYLDYYEKAVFNAKMGSVNEKGGTTYFNPMGTGFFKYFGTSDPADNLFWCCTGTGMEDFMKLQDSIYFHKDAHLFITQYISSTLNWKKKNVKVTIKADLKTSDKVEIIFLSKEKQRVLVSLRKPTWSSVFLVDGKEKRDVYVDLEPGKKAVLEVTLEKRLQTLTLPDCDEVLGFSYGPFVLAAKLPTEDILEVTEAGIDVYAPKWKMIAPGGVKPDIEYAKTFRAILKEEYLSLPKATTLDRVKKDPSLVLKKKTHKNQIEYQFGDYSFVPYDEIKNERYGIYWYFQ